MKKNAIHKQVFLKTAPAQPPLQRLVIHCSEQDFYFHYRDIVCMEAESSQSNIYTRQGSIHDAKIVVCKTLKQLEEMLPPSLFLRVHKSWLVNMQYVAGHKKGDQHSLKMNSGLFVPVSEIKLKEVIASIEQFDISAFTN